MARFYTDPLFKLFYRNVELMLVGMDSSSDDDFNKKQKKQVESLVKAEKKFKRVLQRNSRGEWVYKKFINFIVNDNLLAARPYFRERQKRFSSGISPAIKNGRYKDLYRFDINFTFINFVLKAYDWGKRSKVSKAADEVFKIRNAIITANIPLAISRAKIFRQKTPEAHLTYMDMVQISMEGLINAVDKFVLPYAPVFRSVIIGRCVGDLIESYSETMLHFYPSDKRKIYRANKINKIAEDCNYDALAHGVNDGIGSALNTNADEIRNLTMASSHYSLDMPVSEVTGGYEDGTIGDRYCCDDSHRPDISVENSQIVSVLYNSIEGLDVFERKLLSLKGIGRDL